jgi:hypothetical protein
VENLALKKFGENMNKGRDALELVIERLSPGGGDDETARKS